MISVMVRLESQEITLGVLGRSEIQTLLETMNLKEGKDLSRQKDMVLVEMIMALSGRLLRAVGRGAGIGIIYIQGMVMNMILIKMRKRGIGAGGNHKEGIKIEGEAKIEMKALKEEDEEIDHALVD